MFFERFVSSEQSEIQKLLAEANAEPLGTESPEDAPLSDRDLRIIGNGEIVGMLSTNEPPAVKFVSSRIRGILTLATSLPHAASADRVEATLAALQILTCGTPAVARAVLSDPSHAVKPLCHPLIELRLRSMPSVQTIGNAGGWFTTALDSQFFEELISSETHGTTAGEAAVFLPMHACMILASSLRVTAIGSSATAADCTRRVAMSGVFAPGPALQNACHDMGSAAASALGISKHSETLVEELFSLHPSAISAFKTTLADRVDELHASCDVIDRIEARLKVSALLRVVESAVPRYAPGTPEGDHLLSMVQDTMTSSHSIFLDIAFNEFFSDMTYASSSMRTSVTRWLGCLSATGEKWTDLWGADVFIQVCERVSVVSALPGFLEALRGSGRREDQLRCVELVALAFRSFNCLLRLAPTDQLQQLDSRKLLPVRTALETVGQLIVSLPVCDILQSALVKVVSAARDVAAHPSASSAEAQKARDVVVGIMFDELKVHEAAASAVSRAHGAAIGLLVDDVLQAHGDLVMSPRFSGFVGFVNETALPAVRAAAFPVGKGERDMWKLYVEPAFPPPRSVSNRCTSRVVVDEIDTPGRPDALDDAKEKTTKDSQQSSRKLVVKRRTSSSSSSDDPLPVTNTPNASSHVNLDIPWPDIASTLAPAPTSTASPSGKQPVDLFAAWGPS